MKKELYRHILMFGMLVFFAGILFGPVNTYARDGGAKYEQEFSQDTKPKTWSQKTGEVFCDYYLDIYLEISMKNKPSISKLRYYGEISEKIYTMKLPDKWKYDNKSKTWKIKVKLNPVYGFTYFWVYDTSKYSHEVTYKVIPELEKKIGTWNISDDAKGILINWKKMKECYLSIEIYKSVSEKGTYKKIKTVNIQDGKYVDKLVQDGKSYYYKLRYCYRTNSRKLISAFTKPVKFKYEADPIVYPPERITALQAYKSYLNTILSQHKLKVLEAYNIDQTTWTEKWISNVDVKNIRFSIVDLNIGDGIPELLLKTSENPYQYLAYKYYGGEIVCFQAGKHEEIFKISGGKNIFVNVHSWKEETYNYCVMNGKYDRTVAKIIKSSVYNSNVPAYYIGNKKVTKSKFDSYMKNKYKVTSSTKLSNNSYSSLTRKNINAIPKQ